METIWQDLKYGTRSLARAPGFTLVAVLTLALGIGANTAIFSVVNGILLRPLPYPEPDRLVQLWNSIPRANVRAFPLSAPEFDHYGRNVAAFQHAAAFAPDGFNLTGEGDAERISGANVTPAFFDVMGVKPLHGRTFIAEDSRNADVVVISHGLWQRRFGSRAIVGSQLRLSGRLHSVVGVMPPGFNFPDDSEMWALRSLTAEDFSTRNLGHQSWRVIARLSPGVAHETAQSELDGVAAQFYSANPQFYDSKSPWRVNAASLPEQTVGAARTPVLVLLGAVGLVLLIACANVANLLLVRAAGRRRELAVRAALGAGAGRLVRQMLTESLLLAIGGGLAGLLLGAWGVEALLAVAPQSLPRLGEIRMDSFVLGFSFVASLLTGLGFAFLPAWRAAKADPYEALRDSVRVAGGAGEAGRWLAALQVGVSLVLLVGAGLLLRSFWNVLHVDPGFRSQSLLTARISPPPSRYPTALQESGLFQRIVDGLNAAPGVESAACVSSLPLSGRSGRAAFSVENWTPEEKARSTNVHFRAVTPGYFRTMGIPLVRGRELTEQDVAEAPLVAVINRNMAQRYWPDKEALGARISFGGPRGPWIEIVGVMGNVQHQGLDAEVVQEIYLPYVQQPFGVGQGATIVVRGAGDPVALTSLVRAEVARADAELPAYALRPMDELLDNSIAQRRFQMLLLLLFAVVATALAAVGFYGVIAYSVGRRTAEFGVRMALGAQRGDVLRLVLRQGFLIASVGLAGGLVASLGLTRLVQGLLFGAQAFDVPTYAGVLLLLAAVVLLATYVPARRATRIDPLVALRHE